MSDDRHPRLSAATLAGAATPLRPTYDRSGPASIVHLGVGAFARAHLAVYADDLCAQGWPARIRGVSLRSPRAEQLLAPQDGLFSVAEREPDHRCPLRVVGSLTAVRTGVDAALDAVTAPTTGLVTVTVTEKGYELDPSDLAAQPGQPARSLAAVLAHALGRRRAAGLAPPVVASLDNVVDNGELLRERVLDVAERLDGGLADWIADEVRFPCSVVDRMVPATTPADLADVEAELGLRDEAAVVAEHHRSWVIAETDGLPPLADVGVRVVGDTAPYQRRKLWLLNGPHSALAYCGLLVGVTTIAEAAAHPVVGPFARAVVRDVLDTAPLPEAEPFAVEVLRRFRNPVLGHSCLQVGADGSRKLPQRIVPVVVARRASGLSCRRFAVVTAAWLAAVAGLGAPSPLPAVDDPATEVLHDALDRGGLTGLVDAAVAPYSDPAFCTEVVAALQGLMADGAAVLGLER